MQAEPLRTRVRQIRRNVEIAVNQHDALVNALELAEATIRRLERHAPGSANGTFDVIKAALAGVKGACLTPTVSIQTTNRGEPPDGAWRMYDEGQ